MLYNGMVLPYLQYYLMVWGSLRQAVTRPAGRPWDFYRQQVSSYAWNFWNRRLPENEAAMLQSLDG